MNSGYSMTVTISSPPRRRADLANLSSRRVADTPGFGSSGRAERKQVENQQRDPEIDRRVGDIEDEEVTAERVQVEIVDHRPVHKAVDRVAERAADDQSKADGGQSGSARASHHASKRRRRQRQREQNRLRPTPNCGRTG